jgi:hypothetical protein
MTDDDKGENELEMMHINHCNENNINNQVNENLNISSVYNPTEQEIKLLNNEPNGSCRRNLS